MISLQVHIGVQNIKIKQSFGSFMFITKVKCGNNKLKWKKCLSPTKNMTLISSLTKHTSTLPHSIRPYTNRPWQFLSDLYCIALPLIHCIPATSLLVVLLHSSFIHLGSLHVVFPQGFLQQLHFYHSNLPFLSSHNSINIYKAPTMCQTLVINLWV